MIKDKSTEEELRDYVIESEGKIVASGKFDPNVTCSIMDNTSKFEFPKEIHYNLGTYETLVFHKGGKEWRIPLDEFFEKLLNWMQSNG